MYVIWHDNVTPDCNIVIVRGQTIPSEILVDLIVRQ